MANYTKTQLNSLNEDELIQIGVDEFNLELDEAMSKAEIIDEIFQAIKATKENKKDAAAAIKSVKDDDKVMVKVVVAKGGENEMDYVAPAINGRVWRIKRGSEVEVPKFVARHLQSLSQTIYKNVTDSNGKITGRMPEEVARYNIQVQF